MKISHVVGFIGCRLVGKLLRTDEIAAAQLPRIDAQFAGRLIHHPFQNIDRFGATGPPVGIDLNRVGIDPFHPQPGGLNVINTGQNTAEQLGLDGLAEMRVIGSQIALRVHTVAGDPQILVKGQLCQRRQIAPAIVAQHRFAPV